MEENSLTEEHKEFPRIVVTNGDFKDKTGYLYLERKEDAMIILDGGGVADISLSDFEQVEPVMKEVKELPPYQITDGEHKEKLAYLVGAVDKDYSTLRLGQTNEEIQVKNTSFEWKGGEKTFADAIHKDSNEVVRVYSPTTNSFELSQNQSTLYVNERHFEIYSEGDLRILGRAQEGKSQVQTEERQTVEPIIPAKEITPVLEPMIKEVVKTNEDIAPFRINEGPFKNHDGFLVRADGLDHSILKLVKSNTEVRVDNKSFDWNDGAKLFSDAIHKDSNEVIKVFEQKSQTTDPLEVDKQETVFIQDKSKAIFDAGDLRFITREGKELAGNQSFEQLQKLSEDHQADMTARILDEQQIKALRESSLPIFAEPHVVQGYYVGVMLKPNVDRINQAFEKAKMKPMSDYRRDYGGYTEKQLLALSLDGSGLNSFHVSGDEYKKLAGKNIPLNVVESKSNHEVLKVTYNVKDESKVLKQLYSGQKEFDDFIKSPGKNATLRNVPESVRQAIRKLDIPHLQLKNTNLGMLVKEKDLPMISKLFQKEKAAYKPVLHEPDKVPSRVR